MRIASIVVVKLSAGCTSMPVEGGVIRMVLLVVVIGCLTMQEGTVH
jgi:hypothetical protein